MLRNAKAVTHRYGTLVTIHLRLHAVLVDWKNATKNREELGNKELLKILNKAAPSSETSVRFYQIQQRPIAENSTVNDSIDFLPSKLSYLYWPRTYSHH
jgi:hypothetical protein